MNKLKKIIATFMVVFVVFVANAQTQLNNDFAKEQRTQQSLYIVMAVVITIVVGLFLYLISLDRKINKLQKEIK
jgi:CcmD family protein